MKDLNLINFHAEFPDEKACIDYLAKIRWGDEPICPHCGSITIYEIKTRNIFKCNDCKKQFTVRIGTIFEESRLPLQKWFYAIYLLTSQKKGISSVRIAEYLGITQKTAWFMLQRIRYALNYGLDAPLSGIVEVDETYIGGRTTEKKKYQNKVAVIGAVEKKKDGRISLMVTKQADATVALPFIRQTIRNKETVSIQTDESRIYSRLKYEYKHEIVTHSLEEYVRAGISTNTIDGAWNHLKLGLRAIYLGVSFKHLPKYVDEFEYRYNTRNLKDSERFARFFKEVNGKRLTYETLTD